MFAASCEKFVLLHKIEAHPSLGDVCGPATFAKRGVGSFMAGGSDYGVAMMEQGKGKNSMNIIRSEDNNDDEEKAASQIWSTIADPRVFEEIDPCPFQFFAIYQLSTD